MGWRKSTIVKLCQGLQVEMVELFKPPQLYIPKNADELFAIVCELDDDDIATLTSVASGLRARHQIAHQTSKIPHT